jgi:hypothetical protein
MSQDITVEFVPGPDDDVDAVELDDLAHALREEILQVDEVDSVEQAIEGEAPDGTKAVDVAAIGSLIVAAAPGVTALTSIITAVRSWFQRRADAAPTPPPPLKLTINGNSIEIVADEELQKQLIAEFLTAIHKDDAKA